MKYLVRLNIFCGAQRRSDLTGSAAHSDSSRQSDQIQTWASCKHCCACYSRKTSGCGSQLGAGFKSGVVLLELLYLVLIKFSVETPDQNRRSEIDHLLIHLIRVP